MLQSIADDGQDVITDDEYKLLHDAVLRVLPPEIRSIADLRRREQRKRLKEEQKQLRHDGVQRKGEERDRNRPIERADFMIAGATIGDDRREACEACREDDPVSLVREPDNPYDSNAILVVCEDGSDLGYVPRILAKDLAPLLDDGARQEFRVKKLHFLRPNHPPTSDSTQIRCGCGRPIAPTTMAHLPDFQPWSETARRTQRDTPSGFRGNEAVLPVVAVIRKRSDRSANETNA